MYNQLEDFRKNVALSENMNFTEILMKVQFFKIIQVFLSLKVLEFQSIICTITELLIVTLTFHCLGFASRVFSLAIFAIPITPLN